MKIKCVKEIPTEYITVGQEYNVFYEESDDIIRYRRTDNSCGSYMSIASLYEHYFSGAIRFVED